MRKPIEEMTAMDFDREFREVFVALDRFFEDEAERDRLCKAVRAYSDRQNDEIRKELDAQCERTIIEMQHSDALEAQLARLKPRPMSEMPDELRDGRYVALKLRSGAWISAWFAKERNKWYCCDLNAEDAYFTHFMLIPEVE